MRHLGTPSPLARVRRSTPLPQDPSLLGRVNRAHPFCRIRTGPSA